jgi:hypothetical protein
MRPPRRRSASSRISSHGLRSFPGGHTAELHITHKGHDLLEAGKRAYASADNDLSLVLGNEQLTVLTRFLLTALAARQPGS